MKTFKEKGEMDELGEMPIENNDIRRQTEKPEIIRPMMQEDDMTSDLAMHYFNEPLPQNNNEVIQKRKKSGDE